MTQSLPWPQSAEVAAPAKPSAYTPHDHELIDIIKAWLAENNKTRSWLSKISDIPGGTVSQILSGKYASSPSKQLGTMLSCINVEDERLKDGTAGYIIGSVHRLMEVVYERTRKHRSFGVVTGYVGVGKTRTATEYSATTPLTLLVEASPSMTAGVLLGQLLDQLNAPAPAGLDRMFREVLKALRGTNYLLIVDEAEKVSAAALEYLRRIRDLAQVGIVLQGTEKLAMLIKPQHGQFDQIRSRVHMWPKTIESINRDDADDMARAALGEAGELDAEVLDALWAYCDGSARVLCENLVPAIRDYGIGKGALTAALVQKIAKAVLFMDAPRAPGSKA